MRIYCIMAICALLILGTATLARCNEHPCTGQEIKQNLLETTYAGNPNKPAGLSTGQVVFSDPSEYPDITELTHEEQYIFGGAQSAPWDSHVAMLPWMLEIYFLISKYYQAEVPLPEVLSADNIRQLAAYSAYTDDRLEVFRNPMTGEWPVLEDSSGVAGSVFIHQLTDEEKYQLAIRDEEYKKILFLDSFFTDVPPGREHRDPYGPPIYMRIVGVQGKPLLEYIWAW